jgi:hypothetical protein
LPKVWPLTLAATLLGAYPAFVVSSKEQAAVEAGAEAVFALLRQPDYWLSVAVSGLLYIAVFTILLVQLDTIARGTESSRVEALMTGLKRVVPMIALTLSYLALVVFGVVLLIVPGIYWGGVFQLAFIPLAIGQAGVSDSFRISKQLIKGHWWRASSIVAVGLIVPMLADPLATVVGEVLAAILRAGDIQSLILQQIVSGAVNVFLLSLPPAVMLAVYYELKRDQ